MPLSVSIRQLIFSGEDQSQIDAGILAQWVGRQFGSNLTDDHSGLLDHRVGKILPVTALLIQ